MNYKVVMVKLHLECLGRSKFGGGGQFKERYNVSSNSLQYFPDRNPRLSDSVIPNNKYCKMIINKRYMLIYQVKVHTVFVDYILDCRRDYQWLI